MRPFMASKYIIKVHVYKNLTNVKFLVSLLERLSLELTRTLTPTHR
jgi:hypothetical protein